MAKKVVEENYGLDPEVMAVISGISKKYGDPNTIMVLGQGNGCIVDRELTSTGSICIDRAVGVIAKEDDGTIKTGIPRGRIIEIFGPESSGKTTLLNHMIAQTQRQGKLAAIIDMEQTWDAAYAANIGVDTDKIVFSQPSYAEQALDILDSLVRTGKFGIICLDSIAALVPQKELEGQMGESSIGVVARLMSQALRKINGFVNRTDTIVVMTNQIREKIGVMFGCWNYGARVVLEDGSTKKIGWIVNNKYNGKVKTLNTSTGKVEYKKIINWFDNGKANKWFLVTAKKKSGNGVCKGVVGDDHTFITPQGEKRLSELSVGSKIFVLSKKYLSETDKEIVVGSLLGDGSIRVSESGTGRLRVGHGREQRDYCEWKMNRLSNDFIACNLMNCNIPTFESKYTDEISWLAKYKSGGALRFVDDKLLSNIGVLSLAIWYLDDGTYGGCHDKWGKGKSMIYATKLCLEDKQKLVEKIKELTGAEFSCVKKGIMASGNDSWVFQKAIAKFVPLCMKYKLHQDLWKECDTFNGWENKPFEESVIESEIIGIKETETNGGATHKFDIQIEDNSNYFVDNMLVHNSPETTPGGNAMKYYASIRIDIRKIGQLKDGSGDVIGNRCKVKIIKNKVAPPMKSCEFDILYGEGIDNYGELVDMACDFGILTKKGSWFSYGSENIAQGRSGAVEVLKSNEELFNVIKSEVLLRMYGEVYETEQEEVVESNSQE